MKHKLLAAVGVAALMVIPSVATAQDDSGWYVRGNVGYGAFTDADIEGDLVGDIEAEGNGAGTLGLGYDFGNNWRLEADGSTMWNDMGAISQLPNSGADFRANALMLNAIYDFNDFGRWEPYVGAGVGYVQGKLSAQAQDFPSRTPFGAGTGAVNVSNPACSPICSFSDKDSGLGWQLLAGLGYDISDNLSWDTHYRYLNASELDFAGTRSTLAGTSAPIAATIEDIGAHMLMTGFRYKFGAPKAAMTPPPPPPPPPAPAPTPVADFQCWDGSMVFSSGECPARPTQTCWDGSVIDAGAACPAQATVTCWDGTLAFDQASCPVQTIEQRLCGQEFISQIIYYEFNKPQSPETRSQLQNILNISDVCQVGSVSLVGHTDTSGSAAYNMTLSRKRANNVKSELVTLGVPAQIITTDGKGETELFIPTADGVKEQLNRRVEVSIRLNSVEPTF